MNICSGSGSGGSGGSGSSGDYSGGDSGSLSIKDITITINIIITNITTTTTTLQLHHTDHSNTTHHLELPQETQSIRGFSLPNTSSKNHAFYHQDEAVFGL